MRSHGSGGACYVLKLIPKCPRCLEANSLRHRDYNQSEAHRAAQRRYVAKGKHAEANSRYRGTAKGMLTIIRDGSKRRQG